MSVSSMRAKASERARLRWDVGNGLYETSRRAYSAEKRDALTVGRAHGERTRDVLNKSGCATERFMVSK